MRKKGAVSDITTTSVGTAPQKRNIRTAIDILNSVHKGKDPKEIQRAVQRLNTLDFHPSDLEALMAKWPQTFEAMRAAHNATAAQEE